MNEEAKVVYIEKRKDGTEYERVLRGIILNENDDFITIKRSNGEFTISKKVITRIEKPTSRPDNHFNGEVYQ